MDVLAQDFATITFQDVVNFCDQKIVENTELDYKMVIPKGLAKHFAAMSNRYGGLIIIGVEEDPHTGKPSRYDGIIDDGKQIDRVHQLANNVRPLPTYDVRTTNEVSGKVFLLIRIGEGGAPPYTQVNDPTVYLRTGNITTPLRPGDAEVVRELYAKRETATEVRQANVERPRRVLASLYIQEILSRDIRRGGRGWQTPSVQAYLQPFYPNRELAQPREIHAALDGMRVTNQVDKWRSFPALYNIRPIERGMLAVRQHPKDNTSHSVDQIYANGLFWHHEQNGAAVQGDESEKINLADIARIMYTTLLFGRKLYSRFNYSGLVQGRMNLDSAQGRPVSGILPVGQREMEVPAAISERYMWPIEANTHQLGNDNWLTDYFYRTMREIYWDLGFTDVAEQVLTEFLEQWRFT